MKKAMKGAISFALIFAILWGFVVPVSAAGTDTAKARNLLDSFNANGETFTLTTASRIFVVGDSAPAGDLLQTVQLAQQQFAAAGRPSSSVLPIVYGPESYAWDGDIVVELDSSANIDNEGYQLDIATTAKVTASHVDGLLYGLNMLLKHMNYARSNIICGFTAMDEPDTIERTVHLDCGRKYFTKNWICNFIRQISWMGYNSLEFHFSEDGGFRADFWDSSYYKDVFQPENDFSWICGSQPQSWVISESTINGVTTNYKNDPDKGKFLTTAELVEICQTAAEYHIDIIPSFDSPAHVDYLTWRFEQYYESKGGYSFKYKGTTYTANDACINYTNYTGNDGEARWPYYSAINIADNFTKNFMFALYTDIANFFKVYAGSENFNIGADEVSLYTSNLASGYSYQWSADKFPAYVNELDTLLNNLGYTTRIFNDFMGSTVYNFNLSDFNSDIEILYWNSPWDPNDGSYRSEDDTTLPATDFLNSGRTMYNVIQTGTYYCTRITGTSWTWSNKDARDPDNRQWRIYNATETGIYNDWAPNDFGEKGDKDETVTIPDNRVAGAYFCLWHDFAALNTEKEIWNGATDKADSSKVYYLFDRMWSNTIKMWNWDIDDTVSYDDYAAVAGKYGDFPGYTSCSSAASLPTATAPTEAYRADHSKLTDALENKLDSAPYSEASYAKYLAAYEKAASVNANHDATEKEIKEALVALEAAQEQLVERDKVVVVKIMAKLSADAPDEEAVELDTESYPLNTSSYNIYMAPIRGYTFLKASGATFTESDSGDGSGYIRGSSNYGIEVTLYYLNTPDTERLEYLVRNEVTDEDTYSKESWAAYQTALGNAKNFTVMNSTTQSDVDAIVTALELAECGLVAAEAGDRALAVEKLTATARLGKQVGMRITTSANVESLSIEGETLTLCVGKVQTLTSGEVVKIWLVYFPADEVGTFTYTITAGSKSTTVEVIVK